MKRVICFDLWGTLVRSSIRVTYEDILAEYWPRELIQKTVRDLLMTNAWIVHPLREHDGILRPDHLHTAAMLLTSLWKIKPPSQFWSSSYDWDAFDMNTSTFARLLFQIEWHWEQENHRVHWIENAQEVLNLLKDREEELVLVTNTTSCGIGKVDLKLNLRHFFKYTWASCAYPFAKPDRRVWECLMKQFPDMDEYWMIGNDLIMDIAAPAAMGWKTILVNHPEGVPISEVPKIIGEAK